jgi:hypothetical protein
MEATNDRAATGKCETSQDLDGLTADKVRDDVARPGNGQLPCAGRPPGGPITGCCADVQLYRARAGPRAGVAEGSSAASRFSAWILKAAR